MNLTMAEQSRQKSEILCWFMPSSGTTRSELTISLEPFVTMTDYPKTPGRSSFYRLDDEGYVVVKFVDQFGRALDLDDALSRLRISDGSEEAPVSNRSTPAGDWAALAGVDMALANLVNSKCLSREDLLDAELTDLVRGAYYNEYLAEQVSTHLGFRPLPLATTILNSRGDEVECRLFPHQVKALTYMRERESLNPRSVYGLRGGVVKMKMGMGKTLTAITHSLLSARPACSEESGGQGFPTLVVASKTVMMEWKTQGFEKFFGDRVKVLYLHSDYLGKDINRVTRKQVVKYDFVVTTYDVCSSVCRKRAYHEEVLEMGDEHTLMKGKVVSVHTRTRDQANKPSTTGPAVIYTTPWERVICDESQRFANPNTQTYRHMMAIYGRYKWCLTGTPIRNYETDIWAQLRFCCYNGVEKTIEWKREGRVKMKTHRLTEAILSMNYKDAGIKLPKKHEYEMYVSLDDREKECYDYVQGLALNVYDEMMRGLRDFACVLALFTRLRQCSIAPYLLTAESKREKGSARDQKKDREAMDMLKKIYTGTLGAWVHDKKGTAGIYSKKMTEIVNVLHKIPKGEKVLIFSMFTSVLDLVADAIRERVDGFDFVQVDGDTKGREREELLTQFRTDRDTQGLLMTYKVGAEGLNLTEATHVICVEPWWTNAVHDQAKARCWRTGQMQEVEVHNIYVKDSIEERIVDICKEKDEMAEAMLEGTGQSIKVGLDKYTLGRILGVRA